jgi:hypothetical protein
MDEPLRIRRARASLLAALGMTFALVGPVAAQEDVPAEPSEIFDLDAGPSASAAGTGDGGFRLGDGLDSSEPRPASAYDWNTPVEGESPSAAPMMTRREAAAGSVTPAQDDLGGELLVDTSSNHNDQRAARYRFGALFRQASDRSLEGSGAGFFFQGPNWYRIVDMVKDPDPKTVGGWRIGLTHHDLDFKNSTPGVASLQNEEVWILNLGVGGDYFFKNQHRQKNDEQGRPMWDRFGDPMLERQNSLYLSAWLETFQFLHARGSQPSTQDPEGGFNNSAFSVTLGLGYQIKSKMRFGFESSFLAGPASAAQFYVGSSF